MMIERIDVLMPPISQYGALHHFTKELYTALGRAGVRCRLIEAKFDEPQHFLDQIFQDLPDCTLSFNGLLPDHEGRFLSDLIKVPHIACLVDSPTQFVQLASNPRTIITCVDRSACSFFRGLNASHVLFMPHAVEKELIPNFDRERQYDVVMLSSCIDYEAIQESWKSMFPHFVCDAMAEAAEITFSDLEIPHFEAFARALDIQSRKISNFDPRKIDMLGALDQLETYISGRERVELVDAISDAKVDVFGARSETAGWEKYLADKSNVEVHDPVPFEQALDVMKQSKIVLNSRLAFKDGAHERVFYGIACGAFVVTNESVYLHEQFQDKKDLAFYRHGDWDQLNQTIHEYLSNEDKRQEVVKCGFEKIAQGHTWDHRAQDLLKQLAPILETTSQHP